MEFHTICYMDQTTKHDTWVSHRVMGDGEGVMYSCTSRGGIWIQLVGDEIDEKRKMRPKLNRRIRRCGTLIPLHRLMHDRHMNYIKIRLPIPTPLSAQSRPDTPHTRTPGGLFLYQRCVFGRR